MEKEQLIEVLNNSDLLPYEIAEAVYLHLQNQVSDQCEYQELGRIEAHAELVQFYLAAKALSE